MNAVYQPRAKISGAKAFAEAFPVSRETLERLENYKALLQLWQKTINLVAPSTLGDVWGRHFADSAQILRLVWPDWPDSTSPAPKTWVDLGSGAGFPGLVIAIMLAQTGQTRVKLVESDSRKAAFLREVARQVAVPVDILPQRIEIAANKLSVEGVNVVSARALAPLPRLLTLAAPLFGPQTVGVFLKGRDAEIELQAAEIEWKFASELVPSWTDAEGRVIVVRDLRRQT